ncbi:MAG: Kelch repeat-containing protein, partial [Bacteroidia bacterium]
DKGYVGTGRDVDNKDQQDFFRYDPLTNTWTKVASIGIKRSGAFAFVLGNKAFVGGGTNNGANSQEFYQYNPTTDSWIVKKDLDQSDNKDNDDDYVVTRSNAATFVINNVAYVIAGNLGFALNSTWRYEEGSDRWTQVDKFEGSARSYTVGFSLKNKGYVATGSNGASRFDDNWRFDPNGISDNKK